MTEIKGAGIDQKEGMTVDGGFHIDDEEVRAGLTDTRAPASDRFIRSLRWEFGLIALVIPIKNVHCGSPATSPAFFPPSVVHRKPKRGLGLCGEVDSDSLAFLFRARARAATDRTPITPRLYINNLTDGGKEGGKSNHNLLSLFFPHNAMCMD